MVRRDYNYETGNFNLETAHRGIHVFITYYFTKSEVLSKINAVVLSGCDL